MLRFSKIGIILIIIIIIIIVSASSSAHKRPWRGYQQQRRRQDFWRETTPGILHPGHLPPQEYQEFTSPIMSVGCGESREIGLHESVFIESPNYSRGKNYPNSITCKWNFHLQNCKLAFTCPKFSLNKFLCLDYLQVSDAHNKSKRFCGTQAPHDLHFENQVKIVFHSSASFNAPGFKCHGICIEKPEPPPNVLFPSEDHPPHPTCACGIRHAQPKPLQMFAKSGFKKERLPWAARIVRTFDGSFICSATLISNQYLITSADCFANDDFDEGVVEKDVMVILNEKSRQEAPGSPKHRLRAVSQILKYHHHQEPSLNAADVVGVAVVALVKLTEPIDFFGRDHLLPICLPKKEDALVKHWIGSIAHLTTWQWDRDWHDQHLVTSRSIVLHNGNCTLSTSKRNDDDDDGRWAAATDLSSSSDSTLCVKSLNPICHPIPGSPLQTVEAKGRHLKHTLIGIGTLAAAGSYNCAQMSGNHQTTTHRFLRVTQDLDWILRSTGDSAFCRES